MGEQLRGHEVSAAGVTSPVMSRHVVRVVKKSSAAWRKNARRLAQIRPYDVAIKMNHGIEAIDKGNALRADVLQIKAIVDVETYVGVPLKTVFALLHVLWPVI